ncbi:hypothetical protein ILT44_07005 [Microvirga sp. BT689]|uniref:hypothetical protein n=1 Tax=Microvirga arvi TaxID=2778731 RepID=UPI00195219FC|nr:hypothetical protein [Microvirga arvi]MBM6579924.1 hypothetical protein [Microvirga arvi]
MATRSARLTERTLHLLTPGDAASRPVSDLSLWGEPIWRFKSTTAGKKDIALIWSFEMFDGSMSTDAQWSELLELGRRLLWSIRVDSQRGKNPKDTGLGSLFTGVRYLLRWMALEGYRTFAELDEDAAEEFCDHLAREKAASDDDEGITAETLARYLDVLVRIHEQSPLFASDPAAVMRRHPFGGRAAQEVADELSRKVAGFIPPVPDPVFTAVMSEALSWLEAPARDLARLGEQFASANERSQQNRSNSYSYHLNKVLERFRFDDGGSLGRPWHPGLADGSETRWFVKLGTVDRKRAPLQRYRRLIQDLRDACVIVVQGLVGLRISEIAGLKAGAAHHPGAWPSCIEVRPSLSGLNEIFYIKGRLFKQRDQWDEVEWVAGSRPAGTEYVPPPVRALAVLQNLYAPWRPLGETDDLIVTLGQSQGMPRSNGNVSRILSDSLRDGQKEFVRHFVNLPAGYQSWNLTTHQWRKSFCLYIVGSDGRLLPAVSDHFKHMSLAMTEQGYLGNDAALLGVMNDVATREAARFLFEAINDTAAFAGKMAEKVEAQALQIQALIGSEGTDEQKIERLAETLRDDDVRVWPADWGKCLFRAETARCHHQAKGDFDLQARQPHYGQRQPNVCCSCSNLLISEVHVDFWAKRHADNIVLHTENLAAGDRAAAAVAAERVRTSETILRRLSMISGTKRNRREHAASS